ncbi:helix-turn-helix transcriptional regulator [Conexibacter sp. JD483]|uniref:helix-turn-helix transcriptional regulator n=1 Tax=unclassified Conexibacter TaxID=2627773 RepID=UPI002718E722|nr:MULTISPECIES: helix-turn-helix transcriptional regulator [unclassified Conexibacter]MDO8187255.1 helix-turn-helix transcriptional regulator [Conexibacter sp. CPCC 205706]MDO8198864.1 helix-turn-helix transcriptional regulator [Conexibacter sp. CPCC 205762]MDR9372626.1 helix-turn-helix transcriptional regulator [Conexibacter sp. JD483]
MDRAQLADFLRRRREALRPEDVGLMAGPRRRTPGLRREEVAALTGMSTDYLARLEQQRGPQPSEQLLSALARGLRLTVDERDHLFLLAGHTPPSRAFRTHHVSPALMRVLDTVDAPALVISDIGHTLAQNELGVALFGDLSDFDGDRRTFVQRWFGDPAARSFYPPDYHDTHGRALVGHLRNALARDPGDAEARAIVDELLARSDEFTAIWEAHEVRATLEPRSKRVIHPAIGMVAVDCQVLVAENDAQRLLVFTAVPGSEDADKLRLLAVVGLQFPDSPDSKVTPRTQRDAS